MVRIVWTKIAVTQLEKSVKYIKETQGTYYANIVLEGVLNHIEVLMEFPKAGRVEPLLEHKKFEYRYLVKWSYKVIYRISKDKSTVYILRVFHTSQDPSKIF
jgi:plasmid stabilization system protein ParE